MTRTVQLVTPFEFCDPNEHHTNNNCPKRLAAANVNAIRRASDH